MTAGRVQLAEPNTAGTSWTSIRWRPQQRASTSTAAAPAERPRPSAISSAVRALRSRFGTSTATGTASASPRSASTPTHTATAAMVFTNAAATSAASPSSTAAGRKGADFRATVAGRRELFSPPRGIASTAASEYVRAASRRKPADEVKPSIVSSRLAESRPLAGMHRRLQQSHRIPVPEVLSRFGSRSPAFLAGGVVRHSAVSPIAAAADPPRPIPKADRPWRQRMADSARLRHQMDQLEVDTKMGSPLRLTSPHISPKGAESLSPRRTVMLERSARGSTVYSAATPTSSVALRNYESKFTKYSDSSRPSSLVLPSAALAARYRPRTSLTPAAATTATGALSRASSTASSTLSLLQSMPSSRYRSSALTKSYTPMEGKSRLSVATASVRTPREPMTSSYTPGVRWSLSPRSPNPDSYKQRDATRWQTVENPPSHLVLDRRSRSARSRSGSRKHRSRSRSQAHEPPPPGSSSDSDAAADSARVPPRRRRSKKRTPNDTSITTDLSKAESRDGRSPMPARAFEATRAVAAPSPPNAKMPTATAAAPVVQLSDVMESSASVHSTITNVSEIMAEDVEEDEKKYNAVARFRPAGRTQKTVPKKSVPVPGSWTEPEANAISLNRHLQRRAEAVIVEITMKHFPLARASTAHFRMPRKRRTKLAMAPPITVTPPLPVATKTIAATFMRPKQQNLQTTINIKQKKPTSKSAASISVKEPKKKIIRKKAIRTAEISIAERLTAPRRPSRCLASISLKSKGKVENKAKLRCKATATKPKAKPTLDPAAIAQHPRAESPKRSQLNLNIQRKPDSRQCNGTVKDKSEVVFAKASAGLKAPQPSPAATQPLHIQLPLPSAPRNSQSPSVSVQVTLAQPPKIFSPRRPDDDDAVSPEPYEPRLHVPATRRPSDDPSVLILPDRSILEEYVKRKRSHLEALRQDAGQLSGCQSLESSFCESPPQQSAVRIVEPPAAELAVITTPSRSRLSSIEPPSSTDREMTPRPNEQSQPAMREIPVTSSPVVAASGVQRLLQNQNPIQQQPSQHPAFRAILRKTSDPTGRLKAAALFETPKSPFEERMQLQAHQLRKASIHSSSDTDNDVSSIASTRPFANSAPREANRYAAHLPVSAAAAATANGRQSTTSVDSTNSGALDTASRQLDQMIDQARHKHQQHRHKFKEAIDYLDQIFEDLKKECEPTSPKRRTVASPPQRQQSDAQQENQRPRPFPITRQQTQPAATSSPPTRPATNGRVAEPNSPNGISFRHTAAQSRIQPPPPQPQPQQPMTAAAATRPSPPQQQRPIQVHQTQPQHATFKAAVQRQPLRKQRSNVSSHDEPAELQADAADVDVSETIVLPPKNTAERLDFTRQWLVDDIRGWVEKAPPKPDGILDGNEIAVAAGAAAPDSDEHSLGSCSAEVAAINERQRRPPSEQSAAKPATKTRKPVGGEITVTQKPKQQPAVAAAAPQQPAAATTAANGPIKPRAYRPQPNGQPNGALAPDAPIFEMHKVASQQELRPATRESVDRPGSQDYHSVGSANSNEGGNSLRAPAAFNSNSLQRSASGAFVQYRVGNPPLGSIQSLPDAMRTLPLTANTSGYASSTLGSAAAAADPVLAMDALVAELELNTDEPMETADKRRSFPTTQTDAFRAPPQQQQQQQRPQRPIASTAVSVKPAAARGPPGPLRLNVPQQPNYTGSMDRGMRKLNQQPAQSQLPQQFQSRILGPQQPRPRDEHRQQFDDATTLLDSVIGGLQFGKPQQPPPSQPAQQQRRGEAVEQRRAPLADAETLTRPKATDSPTKTPRRILTMQNTVPAPAKEPIASPPPQSQLDRSQRLEAMHNKFSSNPATATAAVQRSPFHRRQIAAARAAEAESAVAAEPAYSEIAEFRRDDADRPAIPATSPPAAIGSPTAQRLSNAIAARLQRNASMHSQRTAGFDPDANVEPDELADDADAEAGFYDNIRRDAARPPAGRRTEAAPPPPPPHRYPPSAPPTGLYSPPQPPPPQSKGAGARIGQLIRKLGGVADRPTVQRGIERMPSAVSVLSLNRIDRETAPRRAGTLMKSNSLSHEPWRIHAMQEAEYANPADTKPTLGFGIGNKLKQTIFGSRKWLNT